MGQRYDVTYDMGNTDFVSKGYEVKAVLPFWIPFLIPNMSGVQPFQFEPTYPPGEEPVDSDEERDEGDGEGNYIESRIGNTEWCLCGSNCVPMSTADECFCCQLQIVRSLDT